MTVTDVISTVTDVLSTVITITLTLTDVTDVDHASIFDHVMLTVDHVTLQEQPSAEDKEFVNTLERDVFIAFAVMYIVCHIIFIFWLYFDVSVNNY